MLNPYLGRSLEICHRTRHLDNAVVSPGTQVKLFHGGFQHRIGGIIEFTIGPELFGTHLGVAMCVLKGLEPQLLNLPRSYHPAPDICTLLALPRIGQLPEWHRHHFNLDIYPIEQRPRNLRQVLLHHTRATTAVNFRMVVIATGTSLRWETVKW